MTPRARRRITPPRPRSPIAPRQAGRSLLAVLAALLLAPLAASAQGDLDGDGVENGIDNCPLFANADQLDTDGDSFGDACECGDANLDGRASTLDARLIQRCAAGELPRESCGDQCDVTGDGVCTTVDSRLIQRHASGQLPADVLRCERRPLMEIPRLLGRTETEAVSDLADAGFKPGTVGTEPSAFHRSGSVLEQRVAGIGLPAIGSWPAGARVDVALSAPPPANAIVLPPVWAGLWEWDLRHFDGETNALRAQTRFDEAVCAGDSLGLWSAEDPFECVGSADAGRVLFSCSAEVVIDACTVTFRADGHATLAEDTIDGVAQWGETATGACPPTPPTNEVLELRATRVETNPPSCVEAPTKSLTQVFVRTIPLPAVFLEVRP